MQRLSTFIITFGLAALGCSEHDLDDSFDSQGALASLPADEGEDEDDAQKSELAEEGGGDEDEGEDGEDEPEASDDGEDEPDQPCHACSRFRAELNRDVPRGQGPADAARALR